MLISTSVVQNNLFYKKHIYQIENQYFAHGYTLKFYNNLPIKIKAIFIYNGMVQVIQIYDLQ